MCIFGSMLYKGVLFILHPLSVLFSQPSSEFCFAKTSHSWDSRFVWLAKANHPKYAFGVFSDLDNDLFLCNGLDFGVETILWCIVE